MIKRLFAAIGTVIILYFFFRLGLPFFPEPIGSRSGIFITGATRTFQLTLSAGVFGLLVAVFCSFLQVTGNIFLIGFVRFYVWMIQGTPLLVQIFFFYFAVPKLFPFFNLDDNSAAVAALAFNVGAYHFQAIQAGIHAIPKGQIEAAKSLALSDLQTMRFIVLPQALKTMIPPLTSNTVALLKDSALVSSIGILELSLAGNRVTSETFDPVPVLFTVASFYLVMSTVLLFFTGQLRLRVKA